MAWKWLKILSAILTAQTSPLFPAIEVPIIAPKKEKEKDKSRENMTRGEARHESFFSAEHRSGLSTTVISKVLSENMPGVYTSLPTIQHERLRLR